MVPERPFQSHPPRRGSVDLEEQRAWVGCYRRVGRDAALATEVLAQLDGDAEMKRRHLALYLCCKQSLRVHKARQARDRRVALWLRMLVRVTLLRPVVVLGSAVRRAFDRGLGVLAEAVATGHPAPAAPPRRAARSAPAAAPEGAAAQVRSLLDDAEFADARARFQQQAGMSPVPIPEHGEQPREASPAPAVPASRR